jgi:dTDP-glucose pyrophosphorylase
MLNIVIPMAGRGSRFEKVGYTFPKPLIDVDGSAMIARVIENLKPEHRNDVRFIFICQREHCEKYDLEGVLSRAVGDSDMEIIKIDGITQGAACTVLLAADFINNDDELLIANSDQLIENELGNWYHAISTSNEEEGLIMCFKANHPKWSYAKVDSYGRVLEVAEKKVISDMATTGVYWFKHGKDFVAGAKQMIEKDIRTNNEFYVCPIYNELIITGKKIYVFEIERENMKGLGTPEDLEKYLKN